jgi:hypothetical protein
LKKVGGNLPENKIIQKVRKFKNKLPINTNNNKKACGNKMYNIPKNVLSSNSPREYDSWCLIPNFIISNSFKFIVE